MDILSISNLEKSYPGVKALDGVDLFFRQGEVHGLVGENGAGKSTLIKILAGLLQADGGTLRFKGQETEIRNSQDATNLGLCFIHQELNLVSYFNAMENIFLGHDYPRKFGPFIDWKSLADKTKSIQKELDLSFPLRKPVSYLSAVDRAMTAIARAFAIEGQVYFMDEPSTALTEVEKTKLFKVILKLKEKGKTVIYISHNLDDVLQICDRVTVMRDGRVVKTETAADMTKESLISSMIGKKLESVFPAKENIPGELVFKVNGVRSTGVSDISFELHRGEILGIGGLVGSGRTELLEMIYGVDTIIEGEMVLAGKVYSPASPKHALAQRVSLVPEERRKQGLLPKRSIYENISLMSLDNLSVRGILKHKTLKQAAGRAGEDVRLKAADYSYHTDTLSGGNQQKVVFAKTVLNRPRILLLDEPSKGVDVGARFEIYSIIRDLASRGCAVILVSSDFNEILGLSDKILFLKEGRQTQVVLNKNMDQEQYLKYCYGEIAQ